MSVTADTATDAPTGELLLGVQELIALQVPVATQSEGALEQQLLDLERAASALSAQQARVIAELDARARAADEAERLEPGSVFPAGRSEFVADHVAVVLSCTKAAAGRRYDTAVEAVRLPSLMAAWSAGRIDERKVAVIVEGLRDVDPVFADALAEKAAHYAAQHTSSEVRRWLARRVMAADPGLAEMRRRRALADRRLTVTPLPDGLSELSALLPSLQARQVYDTVNALAQAAGTGDARSMDQRRADALVDLICGRAEPPQIQIQVVVPVDTLLGEGAEPGHLAGVGPITGTEVQRLAGVSPGGGCRCGDILGHGDVTFRRLLADPSSGTLVDVAEPRYRPSRSLDRAVRARDVVCRFPGCARPASTTASGTDLDHTRPWPFGPTAASNLAVLCRHHHRLKHSPGWTCEQHPDGTLTWTTPGGRTLTTSPWVYTDVPDPDPPPDHWP